MLDRDWLKTLGVVDFGYTEEARAASFARYQRWVGQKKHQPLAYLSDHRQELRRNLTNYFPEFQSALVFLFSYAPAQAHWRSFYQSPRSNGLKIAGYALGFEGRDYHRVLRTKLGLIKNALLEKQPGLTTRLSLDVHPVLERDLAFRAGLGWFGKNSLLLSRHHGSLFMLGAILLSQKLPLEIPAPETDHCGQCRACIDVCPTGAIEPDRTVTSRKCLATFTIELFKEAPPPKGMEQGTGEVFGCDLCQDVCPWNTLPLPAPQNFPHSEKLADFFLKPRLEDIIFTLENWSNKRFVKEFRETALARTGRLGILKNLKFQRQVKLNPNFSIDDNPRLP